MHMEECMTLMLAGLKTPQKTHLLNNLSFDNEVIEYVMIKV